MVWVAVATIGAPGDDHAGFSLCDHPREPLTQPGQRAGRGADDLAQIPVAEVEQHRRHGAQCAARAAGLHAPPSGDRRPRGQLGFRRRGIALCGVDDSHVRAARGGVRQRGRDQRFVIRVREHGDDTGWVAGRR